MKHSGTFICVGVLCVVYVSGLSAFAEESPSPEPPRGVNDLSDFGPLDTPQQVKDAFKSAVEKLSARGGILVIPPGLSMYINPELASQELVRIPPLPETTRSWRSRPGITIAESNEKQVTVHVPQIVGLAPYREQGSSLDFEPGDQIEQAIGPDPFKPQIFRSWMWENVPGPWPSAVFDIANLGAASRYSVMSVRGGPANLNDVARRQEKKPAWDNFLVLQSSAGVGINCQADFADAAILFQQPHHEQPIKWHYGHEEGKPPKEATLTVSRETGALTFQGGGLNANGPIASATGLSGSGQPARNLRGKNVPVKAGATEAQISFPNEEVDAEYGAFVEQTWLCNRAITQQTGKGFTVQFDRPAPEGAKLHWIIVR